MCGTWRNTVQKCLHGMCNLTNWQHVQKGNVRLSPMLRPYLCRWLHAKAVVSGMLNILHHIACCQYAHPLSYVCYIIPFCTLSCPALPSDVSSALRNFDCCLVCHWRPDHCLWLIVFRDSFHECEALLSGCAFFVNNKQQMVSVKYQQGREGNVWYMAKYRTEMFARHVQFDELTAHAERKCAVVANVETVPLCILCRWLHVKAIVSEMQNILYHIACCQHAHPLSYVSYVMHCAILHFVVPCHCWWCSVSSKTSTVRCVIVYVTLRDFCTLHWEGSATMLPCS